MDKQFMEFWGNACLSAARGQQQLEDMAKWFTGLVDFNDLNTMFSKIYGFGASQKDLPDYFSWWEKSMNELQKSFQSFFTMMDLVPRKAYQDLEEENKVLKLKIAELEKKQPLNTILDEEIKLASEGVKGFKGLMEEQVRQYQELMDNIGKVFMATPTSPQEQGLPPKQQKRAPSRKKTPEQQ
jgi:hypothetical protein